MNRNQNLPVDRLDASSHAVTRAGAAIRLLLMDEAILMVVVDVNHEVYALAPDGLRAAAVSERYPDWIIGTYTRQCGPTAIHRDLREHVRQQQVRASSGMRHAACGFSR